MAKPKMAHLSEPTATLEDVYGAIWAAIGTAIAAHEWTTLTGLARTAQVFDSWHPEIRDKVRGDK